MRFCEFERGCKYPVFGTDKNTGKGYCRSHQTQRTDFDRRTIIRKAMDKQKGLESKVRGLHDLGKDEKNELQLYFMLSAQELAFKPFCEECLTFIPPAYYRAATAHVLPKRKDFGFPSIASNPINKIFLGAGCGCHHKYDKSWDDASKMNVWRKAVVIFKQLYPFIAENEKKNIPQILRDTL